MILCAKKYITCKNNFAVKSRKPVWAGKPQPPAVQYSGQCDGRPGRGAVCAMVVPGVILILIQGAASQMCLNQQISEQDQQLTTDLCLKFDAAAIDLRVVGGAPIKSADAPWHTIVALEGLGELDFTRILGGGSLVTPRLVLTAAHLFWTNSIDGRVCPKHARDLMTAKECHDLKGGCPKGCRRETSDSVQLYFGVT